MPRRLVAFTRPLRQSRMLRLSLLVFVSTSLVNVLGYAFQFVASHRLGVSNYGNLTALLAVVNVAIVPSAILTTIVVKYAAEFRALGDLAHLKRLVEAILRYAGVVAALTLAVGFVFAGAIGGFLQIADRRSVLLCALLLALNIVLPVLRGVMQGVEDFRAYVLSIGIEAAGKALLGVAAAVAGFGTQGMLGGWCTGSAIALAYSAATLLRRYRAVPEAPLFIDVRRLAQTTVNVAVATLVITSLSNADLIIVKHVFDAKTAGLYGLVALAGKTLLFLVGFVPTIVLPRAANAATSGGSPIGVLFQGTAVLVALAGGGLVFYALAPGLVITALGGHAYLAGAYLVLPYAVAMVLLAALNAVVSYKTGIHRFDFVLPLFAIGIGEIVTMSFVHDSPLHVVQIMIVGNALGLALSLLRINAPLVNASRRRDEVPAA